MIQDFLIVLSALIMHHYLRGFLFAATKADAYEDVLADKIAKRVKEELKNEAPR